jgi:hypothetical protein
VSTQSIVEREEMWALLKAAPENETVVLIFEPIEIHSPDERPRLAPRIEALSRAVPQIRFLGRIGLFCYVAVSRSAQDAIFRWFALETLGATFPRIAVARIAKDGLETLKALELGANEAARAHSKAMAFSLEASGLVVPVCAG